MERAAHCTMCGTAQWEWDEDPYAYEPVFHTCPGCQKKDLLSEDDTPRPKGTSVRLISKASAERLRVERARREAEGVSDRPRRRR